MNKKFALLGTISVVINFALLCGLIYFVFWCLQHFGVIGG